MGWPLRCRFRSWPFAAQPGPTPSRHPFKGRVFDDWPRGEASRGPGAREKAQDASWPATGQTRATAGNRMLTPFDRRSAAIADAPETPGCLGSGLASKHRAARLVVTCFPEASAISSPPWLLRLLPAGAVAGWDLHPLESAALSRRTPGAVAAGQSGLIPANLITLAHFLVSSAMRLPKSAGDPPISMPLRSASRDFILGSASAALISQLSP